MTDVFTREKRSQVMASIRSTGNRDTELKLMAILRIHGITGWRRRQRLPGKPDFVFRRERLAVFVDGCFWHGCPEHGRNPGSNRGYWSAKLRGNRRRDLKVVLLLRDSGWQALRFWEHELSCADRVASRLRKALKMSLRRLHATRKAG